MFGTQGKPRDFFPRSIVEQVQEARRMEWLKDLSTASGKHTIVRAKKKRPAIQRLQEIKIYHSGEQLGGDDRERILEEVQLGVHKIGADNYGDLAGWTKDAMDRQFGPEWQCIVGKKDSFGSCLCPMSGCYLNFSVGDTAFLIFRSL